MKKAIKATMGWCILKEMEIPDTKTRIHIPGQSASIDVDFKGALDKTYNEHPYKGIVVASTLEGLDKGDTVYYNHLTHLNNSSYIKYDSELLKVIRNAEILAYTSKDAE